MMIESLLESYLLLSPQITDQKSILPLLFFFREISIGIPCSINARTCHPQIMISVMQENTKNLNLQFLVLPPPPLLLILLSQPNTTKEIRGIKMRSRGGNGKNDRNMLLLRNWGFPSKKNDIRLQYSQGQWERYYRIISLEW